MKKTSIILLSLILTASTLQTDFLTEQKRYKRVRTAFNEKGEIITKRLNENEINVDGLNILIIAYKAEQILEIYAKKKTKTSYKKIVSYGICESSGQPGPKRKQGDYQVPEGFYYIDRYNPSSNFYLSLGINYPNKSDKIKSTATNLGGDIFIHGACVTIGCIPMTDNKIMEIYLYAIHARNSGQMQIPVYIFPFKMTDKNFNEYKNKYKNNPGLVKFWTNLKVGFDKFNNENKELNILTAKNGNYVFNLAN